MPYNSPRLARGPRGFVGSTTHQDGYRKTSALPRALVRGTSPPTRTFAPTSNMAEGLRDSQSTRIKMNSTGETKPLRDIGRYVPARSERGAVSTMKQLKSASFKKMDEVANGEITDSDCSSIGSGSPCLHRKRTGSGCRNVEYRRSAAVPPLMVATLASKFNAIFSQNELTPVSVVGGGNKSKIHVRSAPPSTASYIKSCPASPLRNSTRMFSATTTNKKNPPVTEDKKMSVQQSTVLLKKARETRTVVAPDTRSPADVKGYESDSSTKSSSTKVRRPRFNVKQAVLNYEVYLSSTSLSSPESQRRDSISKHSDSSGSTVGSFTSPALIKKQLSNAAEAQAQEFTEETNNVHCVKRLQEKSDAAELRKSLPLSTGRQLPRPTMLGKRASVDKEGNSTKLKSQDEITATGSNKFTSERVTVSLRKTIPVSTTTNNGSSSNSSVATTTRILSLHRSVHLGASTTDFVKSVDSDYSTVPNGFVSSVPPASDKSTCDTNIANYQYKANSNGGIRPTSDDILDANVQVGCGNKQFSSNRDIDASSVEPINGSKTSEIIQTNSTSVISRGRALFEKRNNTMDDISPEVIERARTQLTERKPPPLPTTQPRKIQTFGSIRRISSGSPNASDQPTSPPLLPPRINAEKAAAAASLTNSGFYLHKQQSTDNCASKMRGNNEAVSCKPSFLHSSKNNEEVIINSSPSQTPYGKWEVKKAMPNIGFKFDENNKPSFLHSKLESSQGTAKGSFKPENNKEAANKTKESDSSRSTFFQSILSKDNDVANGRPNHKKCERSASDGSVPADRKLSVEVGKSNYVVPNTSFLWPDTQSTRPPQPLPSISSIPPPPSTAPPPIPTSAGESPASPRFATHKCNIYDDVVSPLSENGYDDEPLYSEAILPEMRKESAADTASSSPLRNVITYTMSKGNRDGHNTLAAKSDPGTYNDSDEGWVDISDTEMEGPGITSNPRKHLSLPLNTKMRPRTRSKATPRKANLRRSWSQSLRELASATDDGANENNDDDAADVYADGSTGGEEYHDFEDFFDSDESDSTNPDHHYEALYEVIHHRTETRYSGEWYKARQSAMQSNESVEAAGFLEKSPPEDGVKDLPARSSQTIDSSNGGDKMKQLKRNWSLTKSDIRLELSSRLNKIRVKKTSTSASDVHLQTSPTQPADSKKKSWSLRNKFARKKTGGASPPKLRSPSPKKESAHFYVQNYVTHSQSESVATKELNGKDVRQSRPTDSADVRSATETAATSSSANTRSLPPQVTSAATRGRRVSAGSVVTRPTTAPPAPPPYPSRVREGSLSSPESSLQGSRVSLKRNNSDSQVRPVERGEFKRNGEIAEGQAEDGDSVLLRLKSDSDNESVTSGVRYADIDMKRFGTVMVSRSNSTVSSASEIVVVIPKSPKTRSSVASSSSTSSSDTYIQMENVDPAVLHRMSGLFREVKREFDRKRGCASSASSSSRMAPIARSDSKSSEEDDIYLRPHTMSKLSPFEDEPLYQFYNKDVLKRATQLNFLDGSDEDDEYEYEVPPPQLQSSRVQSKLSAMDLITPTEAGQRTLWGELPEVISSGILARITPQQRKLQEAMFELITSEASYLKSLNVLTGHFMTCPNFTTEFSTDCVLSKREHHVLFSDVLPVKKVSEMLLVDLEKRWQENIVISEICDIISDHAERSFSVYVKYCSNQIYQERTLKQLRESNSQFVEVIRQLESSPVCHNLAMHSFLMLPMQRITRFPLLIDAIFHRLEQGTPQFERCEKALSTLNKIVRDCNEGARKMERMEEMLHISRQIDFGEIRAVPLISASRWLVKKGDLVQLQFSESSSRLFGRKCTSKRVYVFLFTDLLLLTRKVGVDSYIALDYCQRNMVQVCEINVIDSLPAKPPDGCKNLFQLTLLQNHDNRTFEAVFSCSLESDRTRWTGAVTPVSSDNPDERIYEQWDCPQVQVIHSYTAQQADELTLEESDVINVLKKVADGWYHGERLRDGVQGWFPANYTEEIVSAHVRARNLRQRYRLLQYLEDQRRKEKELQAK